MSALYVKAGIKFLVCIELKISLSLVQNENGKCIKLKYTSNFQLLVGLPHLSDIQAHDAQNTKQNQELHDITWKETKMKMKEEVREW